MKRSKRYLGLIGLIAMLGFSNAVYAICEFDSPYEPPAGVALPLGYAPPDKVVDLSGQGNFTCQSITGSNGIPMQQVAVVFQRNGDWDLPLGEQDIDQVTGVIRNTPDDVFLFPQGNGSRCDYTYLRKNVIAGRGLNIDGNVDVNDSIACTDGVANVNEVILPEPDIVITGDGCEVTLKESGTPITDQFLVITGTNLDGTKQAICSADGTAQNECVRGCPEFIDVHALQYPTDGSTPVCLPDAATGQIPLYDGNQRCTPCLTAAQAEARIPGFDTGLAEGGATELKLCWEWINGVNVTGGDPETGGILTGSYKPHKAIRSQTTQTELYNACYETTTTVNFFGREITKTVTTCD